MKKASDKTATTAKAPARRGRPPRAAKAPAAPEAAKAPARRGRPPRAAKTPAAPATTPVVFTIAAAPDVPVFLAGTFNDWDTEALRLEGNDGVYSVTLDLAPGTYEYKFLVNGFWTMDPDTSREWVPNGLGTLNSVVVVK